MLLALIRVDGLISGVPLSKYFPSLTNLLGVGQALMDLSAHLPGCSC